ncbi:MAG: hypothetical protein Q8S00_23140 [Deltaproteobacteria bacterium]|nr:hypothetical protein [Deltaproteobacteria bacterium]
MTEQLRIDQALFGYREGHNLVASSVALSPRVRHFLATITDASGPETPEGFEVSYTGLPVPETDYYAFFCTWPAPEMPRPGCVWSHVLLLNLTDLAQLADLSVFRSVCLRPAVPRNYSVYEKPLTLLISGATSGLVRSEEDRAAFLVAAIYADPNSNVVVLDKKNSSWEAIVFSLWSQQWPRLRRTFAFSTGSLGDRRVGGVAFHLQIAPLGTQRLWGRGLPTNLLEFPFNAPPPASKWVRTVLEDLEAGSGGSLRQFLFTYGSDVKAPRTAFVSLVNCYYRREPAGNDDPVDKLAQLATFFPEPADALTLKRDSLTALTGGADRSDLEQAWAAIYFLLESQDAVAFSHVPVDFSSYARLLWRHKRADLLALLGRLRESTRTTDFIAALAGILAPEEIPIFWRDQCAALPRLLAVLPTLATTPAAWNMSAAGQHYLWESLRAATTDPHTWALSCASMLRAQCAFAEQETVTLAGTYITEGLSNWLNASDICLPSRAWREALSIPLARALKETTLPPSLLALAAWALPPEQANSLSGDRADVQAIAREGVEKLPAPFVIPTLFWLTNIGFKTPGQDGLNLLTRAFFRVYDAVARSDYPREAWERLVPTLPESHLWWDWDRCRRLRDALRRWLHDNPDLADAMSHAAPSSEYAQLVQSVR